MSVQILSLNPHIATGGHRHQSRNKAAYVAVTLCAPHVDSISQAYDLCRAQLPCEGILWPEGVGLEVNMFTGCFVLFLNVFFHVKLASDAMSSVALLR